MNQDTDRDGKIDTAAMALFEAFGTQYGTDFAGSLAVFVRQIATVVVDSLEEK
jgi:hypothetical protein